MFSAIPPFSLLLSFCLFVFYLYIVRIFIDKQMKAKTMVVLRLAVLV